jgi:hypothetical protein
MNEPVRTLAERIARRTSRRGLFGRGAGVLFGAIAGTAAGVAIGGGGVSALQGTVCSFPANQPCSCDKCQSNGVCAKPCVILTTFYASGCWVDGGFTCCDCSCPDQPGPPAGWCGCGSDYHNNPSFCPQ